jgi:hypothetical protein
MFASVSSGYCICLQWFSKIFQAFSQVFHAFVPSVSFVFFCMLQLLHLEISKVDRLLHMGCAWKVTDGAGDIRGGVGDVRSGMGPLLVRSLASRTR